MRTSLVLALMLAGAGPALALPPSSLAIAQAPARGGAHLAVSSDAIGADGHIADRNSAYGAGVSPEVNWSAAAGARAYALALEDPDAPGAGPFVHWLVWNIPPSVTRLNEAAPPPGAQGRNGRGSVGYWGPHPPTGTHHYHIEVFALDAPLALKPGADRGALVQAMHGHVLASGEAVGFFNAPLT
jgi:Raf kinase inhibitor-like YbhB/YbcL family protein